MAYEITEKSLFNSWIPCHRPLVGKIHPVAKCNVMYIELKDNITKIPRSWSIPLPLTQKMTPFHIQYIGIPSENNGCNYLSFPYS